MGRRAMAALVILSLASLFFTEGESTTFIFQNNCPYPVFPGTLSGGNSPPLSQTGFQLNPQSPPVSLDAPAGWSGRFWARTSCSTSTGRFVCETGDCGSGQIACNGAGGRTPTTLVEFTLDGDGGKDFYDISLVDGFNVPVSITPSGGGAGCSSATCPANLIAGCPRDLWYTNGSGRVDGCNSACNQFNTDEYCCRGAFGSPDKCHPNRYSEVFKKACPQAYSYAYDDATSTFTCAGASGYTIKFCP